MGLVTRWAGDTDRARRRTRIGAAATSLAVVLVATGAQATASSWPGPARTSPRRTATGSLEAALPATVRATPTTHGACPIQSGTPAPVGTGSGLARFEDAPGVLAARFPATFGGYEAGGASSFTVFEVGHDSALEAAARRGFAPYTVRFTVVAYPWACLRATAGRIGGSMSALHAAGIPVEIVAADADANDVAVGVDLRAPPALRRARARLVERFGDVPPLAVSFSGAFVSTAGEPGGSGSTGT